MASHLDVQTFSYRFQRAQSSGAVGTPECPVSRGRPWALCGPGGLGRPGCPGRSARFVGPREFRGNWQAKGPDV
eukprot:7103907-Pyramimonas_sp.AAC.1